MNMIGDQDPPQACSLGIGNYFAQPFGEVVPISIGAKYPSPLNPSDDDVMDGTGSIYSRFSWMEIDEK